MQKSTLQINAFWVANSPFPSEEKNNSKIGQIFRSEYSGKELHIGWMDIILLKELVEKNSISHIELQNLDILGKVAMKIHKVNICTAYLYKKHITLKKIPENRDFANCDPLYSSVEMGGWNISEYDDTIPLRAQEYLKKLLYLLRTTNVQTVSYSTKRVKATAFFDEKGIIRIISEKLYHKKRRP